MRRNVFFIFAVILLVAVSLPLLAGPETQPAKGKKGKWHPFDIYNHEMHTVLFESVSFPCDNCHKDPASFGDRTKVNRLGCHLCHNNPKPPLPAEQGCERCHPGGKFPKPESHKVDWIGKHQVYAKGDPKYCQQCHSNAMFCIDCHQRRDSVSERVHKRNFKYFHSIPARANPRKCDACHTVNFCQQCHSGRENSSL